MGKEQLEIISISDEETYEKGPVASKRLTTVELAANGPIGFSCTFYSSGSSIVLI